MGEEQSVQPMFNPTDIYLSSCKLIDLLNLDDHSAVATVHGPKMLRTRFVPYAFRSTWGSSTESFVDFGTTLGPAMRLYLERARRCSARQVREVSTHACEGALRLKPAPLLLSNAIKLA
jgi:hypothetical protein